MKVSKGQTWIYNQSLRPYVVLEIKDGDVVYTAATITPAFGKVFRRSITHFKETFSEPDKVTEETIKNAVTNTLKHNGLIQ